MAFTDDQLCNVCPDVWDEKKKKKKLRFQYVHKAGSWRWQSLTPLMYSSKNNSNSQATKLSSVSPASFFTAAAAKKSELS